MFWSNKNWAGGIVLVLAASILGLSRSPAQVLPEDDYYRQTMLSAAALQRWYNPQGLWDSAGWWNSANCLDAIENVLVADNGGTYAGVISTTFEQNGERDYLNQYYDDEGWWALTWIRAFDLTGEPRYLAMAKIIFADMSGGWDDHCGGGLWWTKDRHYKNAIANELFLLVAVRLGERTPADQGGGDYLDWARREWLWFKQSGMINSKNLVNDGLNGDCENNHSTTWTYNQGVLIGGLTELYKVTGDPAYLTPANQVADASRSILVDAEGVLCEPHEVLRGLHGGDAPQFKGIYIRYLAGLYEVTGRAVLRDFLVHNARAVWRRDRDGNDDLGAHWSGPVDAVDAARQSSAMSVLSALAAPVTTNCVFAAGAGGLRFNHQMGAAAGALGWECDAIHTPRAGYLLSGPFLASLVPGTHAVHFRMRVDALSQRRVKLVTLEVRENLGGKILARQRVPWNDFAEANQAQDFPLKFTNVRPGDPLEFRVWWNAARGAPALTLTDVTLDGFQNWTAANLAHDAGRLDVQGNWAANPLQDRVSGCLVRGPGTDQLTPGDHEARFELKVDNFNRDNSIVATISVQDLDTQTAVAIRDLKRHDFPNVLYQTFSLQFPVVSGHHYDFRTYWHYSSAAPWLTQRCVVVRPTGGGNNSKI